MIPVGKVTIVVIARYRDNRDYNFFIKMWDDLFATPHFRILFVKEIDKVKPYLLNNHFLPVLYVYPLLAWFAMLPRAVKSVPSIIST